MTTNIAKKHIFTGFGFGPIQAGLFANEAYASGNFSRIVIAEIDQQLVDAVRSNHGKYTINIATSRGIERQSVQNVEIYNPNEPTDRDTLIEAIEQSTEIATCLPSVNYYNSGTNCVVSLITQGLLSCKTTGTIIYTAENNNHAAEILEHLVKNKIKDCSLRPSQFLNTVIGKMSQVIGNKEEIKEKNIACIAPGVNRAFLVESFNKILVSKCTLSDFNLGISTFLEKEDLIPFEEAKLYGHNAIHALLAYLGALRNCQKISQLSSYHDIMQVAQFAFIEEAGRALCLKYKTLNDPLFTKSGFEQYALDLLNRMTNPFLDDAVERAARDPERKLGINDRLFGTMRLCLEQGIAPHNIALGAAAAIDYYSKQNDISSNRPCRVILEEIWEGQTCPHINEIIKITEESQKKIVAFAKP